MKFGNIRKETIAMNTKTDTTHTFIEDIKYRDGYIFKTTTYYSVRERVQNEKEELAKMLSFRKENKKNWKFETEKKNTTGPYYIIKSWEE